MTFVSKEYEAKIKMVKYKMACVSKEYEVKIKMVKYKMATAKNEIFIGLWHEKCYLMGVWTFGN